MPWPINQSWEQENLEKLLKKQKGMFSQKLKACLTLGWYNTFYEIYVIKLVYTQEQGS